jgi:mono/diheme cytochrome c family protein
MRPLALVVIVLAGAPLFSRGRAPVHTGETGARLSAQQCQGCHERTYQEWSRSRHAQAWSNELFTESFKDRRSPWCVHCHAPLAEQRDQVFLGESAQPELLQEGVNCATCHLRDGVLLSGRAPSQAAQQAHRIRHEPSLGTADFCGGCHEFHLPDFHTPGRPDSPLLMQKTLTEWRASSAARRGQTCQSCHMAQGAHTFPGGHELELVRGALEISWRWSGSSQLCAVLRARDVGHAVPTGDPFRSLRLRLCQDAACGTPVRQRLLMRNITHRGGRTVEGPDRRLAPPSDSESSERTECFELSPRAAVSHWRLELLYAEPHLESRLPDSVSRALLMEGVLPLVSSSAAGPAPGGAASTHR